MPTSRLLPHGAVEALRVPGRARRRERHRAGLVRDGDREAHAIAVGQRRRTLEGVAGALLATFQSIPWTHCDLSRKNFRPTVVGTVTEIWLALVLRIKA